MKIDLKDEIVKFLEAPLRELGVEIADLNLSVYKNETTLKLFVYTQNGVTLAECAKISRAVGDIFEETDYFEDGYMLEVSSPGLDRPLTKIADFKYRIGENVKVEFVDKKRKKITAKIFTVNGEEVVFLDNENKILVPIAEIAKGKIIF